MQSSVSENRSRPVMMMVIASLNCLSDNDSYALREISTPRWKRPAEQSTAIVRVDV